MVNTGDTQSRLESYGAFDSDVIAHVTAAAEWQNQKHFQDLAERYQISDGPCVTLATGRRKPFEYLRFVPDGDYDYHQARILYAPMGNAVDEKMAMRAMRLFAADPSDQLIVIGSPAYPGRGAGKLSLVDCPKVWFGDLSPTVSDVMKYFYYDNIESADHIGYSYGADRAAVAAKVAADYDIASPRAILMESAASKKRSFGRLAIDFYSAGKPLDEYINAAASPPLEEAWSLVNKGIVPYSLGLARASNLAAAKALAKPLFESRVASAMDAQPDLRLAVAWGTASEISADSIQMAAICERLRSRGLIRRKVAEIAISGMQHAGADDIDLHAAIILQAYKVTQ